jgi:hypothetical protein
MYDFYPEWGPARHREDDETRAVRRPRYWEPTPPALVLAGSAAGRAPEARDTDGELPDDN